MLHDHAGTRTSTGISDRNKVPFANNYRAQIIHNCIHTLRAAALLLTFTSPQLPGAAQAIGDLHEFQGQNMVIQDLSFKVNDAEKESAALNLMFVDQFHTLLPETTTAAGSDSSGGGAAANAEKDTYTMGFGPNTYKIPSTFNMGVSSFGEYGGHATLSLRNAAPTGARSSDTTAVNSAAATELQPQQHKLRYIKVGSGVFRVSKAVENGECVCLFPVVVFSIITGCNSRS